MTGPHSITELPLVVDVPDQPCQSLYEANPVLLGFDVLQYHFIPSYREGGVAVRGKPEFAYNFKGYQFWFASAENRLLFIDDPWRFAPAWGGFCSWGIARELPPKWPWEISFLGPPASPWNGWLIVDGVLIFNIWAEYSDLFLQERDSNMKRAVERWKGWFGDLNAGPFNTHCIGHGPLQNWCLSRQPSPWLGDLPECSIIDADEPSSAYSDDPTEFVSTDSGDSNGNASGRNSTGSNGSSSSRFNCSDIALSGGVLPKNCSHISVTGGGIVSNKSKFSDFSNSRYSPYQKKIIIACSSVGAFVFLAVVAFCCRNRIKDLCCKANRAAKDSGANASSSDKIGSVDKAVPVKSSEEADSFSSDIAGNATKG